jgi:hypothetical protein
MFVWFSAAFSTKSKQPGKLKRGGRQKVRYVEGCASEREETTLLGRGGVNVGERSRAASQAREVEPGYDSRRDLWRTCEAEPVGDTL